jgi:hypothetical protein
MVRGQLSPGIYRSLLIAVWPAQIRKYQNRAIEAAQVIVGLRKAYVFSRRASVVPVKPRDGGVRAAGHEQRIIITMLCCQCWFLKKCRRGCSQLVLRPVPDNAK